jgi:TusA-related sulfurtransferase
MTEFEIRKMMRKMKRGELMMVLASYLLEEQGIKVTEEKQLAEVIEQNFMDQVAMEDLRIEIMNSRERLGIA